MRGKIRAAAPTRRTREKLSRSSERGPFPPLPAPPPILCDSRHRDEGQRPTSAKVWKVTGSRADDNGERADDDGAISICKTTPAGNMLAGIKQRSPSEIASPRGEYAFMFA